MKAYDYLIVGAGLFGSVCANILSSAGKKCLVVDKRAHVAGNVFCKRIDDIDVHMYGAHILHTDNKEVWDYLGQFSEFNRYTNSPIANFHGELYNLPFNMNTFYTLWKVKTPQEAKLKIAAQIAEASIKEPHNLEEQAISLVGSDIYFKLIKGYTEKQWGRDCKDLPAFIIRRVPVRFTFDNNYYDDPYQGIPIEGYTKITEKMLSGSEVRLNTDFLADRAELTAAADKIIYTGQIDAYFDYKLGELDWRSLRFENETLDIENYQGNAVVNYTDRETPYTRVIEHKHFVFGNQPRTVITREYPAPWTKGLEPYYPVNDAKNQNLYAEYKKLAEAENNVTFGGRLAQYKYYDMDEVVAAALKAANKELAGQK